MSHLQWQNDANPLFLPFQVLTMVRWQIEPALGSNNERPGSIQRNGSLPRNQ
jgi:hypothetical protein